MTIALSQGGGAPTVMPTEVGIHGFYAMPSRTGWMPTSVGMTGSGAAAPPSAHYKVEPPSIATSAPVT